MKNNDNDKRTIFERMIAVMRDVEPIRKERENIQQNYKYRGIDDVYNALKDILVRHGVLAFPYVVDIVSEDRKSRQGYALIYRMLTVDYYFYGIDGSALPKPVRVVGEGMDSADKAASKAITIADKICLLQVFKIPTSDAKDPEADSHRVKPKPDQIAVDRYQWGQGKGKPLTKGSDAFLENYSKNVEKAAQKNDPRATPEHLEAVYCEMDRREKAKAQTDHDPETGEVKDE